MKASREFSTLIEIMAKLRDPNTGCQWDVEQDFKSIRDYTIEEAYEVWDAIERQDFDDLCSELGDLLLQPVFHAQMATEKNLFDIGDVIHAINEKLIRRHPHVFSQSNDLNSSEVLGQWETIKAGERKAKAIKNGMNTPSLLADVPNALPALVRAEKLAKRVAKVGFDWPDMAAVVEKCREELNEVEVELKTGDKNKIKEEIGDLLFAVACLANKAGVSPESALAQANAKFCRRFEYVEQCCQKDKLDIGEAGLECLQKYWEEVKIAESS